jgi:plastocyanin
MVRDVLHGYAGGVVLKALLLTVVSSSIVFGAVACGGGKADIDALATKAADATPSPALEIRAKGTKFDKDTLVAPAGAQVVLTFDNQDSGVNHNVAVYINKSAHENLFRGDIFEGKETREYRFQAPAAGVYYFRCDVHPDMDGVFITR